LTGDVKTPPATGHRRTAASTALQSSTPREPSITREYIYSLVILHTSMANYSTNG